MRIGLFVPCHMDAFELAVGVATLKLLQRAVGLRGRAAGQRLRTFASSCVIPSSTRSAASLAAAKRPTGDTMPSPRPRPGGSALADRSPTP